MKYRSLLLAKDGSVVEFVRAEPAARRIVVARDHRHEFRAEMVLRLDADDKDPVVLYREVP